MKKIPYNRQNINKDDIKAVVSALKSDLLTQGKHLIRFQENLSRYCGSKYTICVNSATSALILVIKALKLKKNDYVWTSINTFTSSSTCALHAGLKIDFLDIDKENYNICISSLEKKLKESKKKNKLPKVIIVVHLSGVPINLEKINFLSKKYNFQIIEDASHALGSIYKKSKIGSCKFSLATIFSFHPVKNITSGEGGAILTNNFKLYENLDLLKQNGIHKNKKKFKLKNNWHINYYEQTALGYNFKLDEISSALGNSQLNRLDFFVDHRNILAKNYIDKLSDTKLEFQKIDSNMISAYHLFIINFKNYGKKIRDNIYKKLSENQIESNIHYIPLALHPFYKKMGFKIKSYPNAEDYYKFCLSIPIYVGLKKKEQNFIISLIRNNLHK